MGQGICEVVMEGQGILENLRLGMQDTTRVMVEEAYGAAMLYDFVGRLEAEYETILGGEKDVTWC
jgi:ABC-type multidrug transport system fused ATPase/permease subunit